MADPPALTVLAVALLFGALAFVELAPPALVVAMSSLVVLPFTAPTLLVPFVALVLAFLEVGIVEMK